MTLQLQPQTSFTIVRQLGDHTDLNTYYVRAVVRDSVSDSILQTVNLTNKTSGRFKGDYITPADRLGFGVYIDITTSVYTDSGYTTKSSSYSDENETYLVQDRILKSNGGSGIGIRDIKDAMSSELAKVVPKITPKKTKDITIPQPINYSKEFSSIFTALSSIAGLVSKIEMPSKEKVELEPVLNAISDAKRAIIEKEVTPPTDVTALLNEIENGISKIILILQGVGDGLVGAVRETIKNEMNSVSFESKFVTSAKKNDVPSTPLQQEGPKPIDINNLSL
jgi:hypothetical protein